MTYSPVRERVGADCWDRAFPTPCGTDDAVVVAIADLGVDAKLHHLGMIFGQLHHLGRPSSTVYLCSCIFVSKNNRLPKL